MTSKINIFKIVKDHLLSLRDNRTEKLSFPDILTFYIFPILVSFAVVCWASFLLENGLIELLLTIFSIFTALLFNVLLLVFDISQKSENEKRKKEHERRFNELIKELFSNISYLILLSIFILLFLFILSIPEIILVVEKIINIIIISASINFVLTMLMILKRVYAIFESEIKLKL